jgi:hypothetical protein
VREKLAQPLYEQGFEAWKRALARQDCRARRAIDPSRINQVCRDFRDLVPYQEEIYEHNLRYTKIMDELDRDNRRNYRRWLNDTVTCIAGMNGASPFQWATSLSVLAQDHKVGEDAMKKPIVKPISETVRLISGLRLPGPMDELAADGTPWINDDIVTKLRVKYGLAPRQAPPSEPTEPLPQLPQPKP